MTGPKSAATPPPVTIQVGSEDAPSSAAVNKFHANSDVDSASTGQHHTLGIQHNQASPGDHKHDGKASKRIGAGINPSFPSTAAATYNQADFQSVLNALRALGFGT